MPDTLMLKLPKSGNNGTEDHQFEIGRPIVFEHHSLSKWFRQN
jgi:hypothetical protein